MQWYFTFVYRGGLGLAGIWIAKVTSEAIVAIGYFYIVQTADFEKVM